MDWLIQMLFVGLLAGSVVAGDAPRGFMELDELEEAQAKARKTGKLIALTVKGRDDACPRCAAALENGTKAIKSDCVMVFMRTAQARAGEGIPDNVHEKVKNSTEGAAVTFYVFDPELEEVLATASRKELESGKKATRAFKDKVDDARKALKEG